MDVSRVPQVSGSPLSQEDKSFFFFTPVLWNGLYRRDFLENRGIRLGGGRFHDDVAFHFMISVMASHIETIDEPLYYYRTDNPQSMSKRISEYMSVFESLDYAEQNLDLSNELIQSIFYKYAFGKMVYGFKNVDLK